MIGRRKGKEEEEKNGALGVDDVCRAKVGEFFFFFMPPPVNTITTIHMT